MSTPQPAPKRTVPAQIDFPEALPVSERRADIEAAIRDNQVVILAGETGSGKTTQLPKICLSLGRGRQLRIGHTQPRRIAARTVAQRIADELKTTLGDLVGYQIRFNDTVSDASAIKLMTDGILLAELTHDRDLSAYDTLIIDEAHERSLNIDFLLGYLKQLLPRRPDLKVIVTSATIDVARFSEHFNDAPVIEVSGRTYPVDVQYVGDTEDRDEGVRQQIADLLVEIEQGMFGPRGDALVFLPGERDIRELAKALRDNDRLRVLPLYARLSQAEQNRVFQSGGSGMRVVLATNVAETSLTVPGIRYVIDPGEARISRYSVRSRLQRLPIEPISQASANQRKGRCGRLSDGVCFRLYSEQDFLGRPEFTDPEIRRTNLAAVVLRMLELGLGEVDRFPFIDPPDPKVVRDGYRLLEELGAVSARGKLTALGQRMARLPVDPRLGRMLLAAKELGCLAEVLVIVSAMSIQDPRERPTDKQAQADQAHARFQHPRSDFLAWLALWRYYEAQRQALSQNQLRKLCQREYLAYMRMREWREIHSQLVMACRQLGFRVPPQLPEEEAYEAVHQALLTGLLGNVAQRDEGKQFNATRNRKIVVFPGSGQYKKPPPWLVAGEIVETTQVYARQCGAIEPDWLLRVNPRVLKRHHYEPAWQRRSGRVMAKERVTLYGLTISDGRRVHFGDIDAKAAREIFIRDALVTGNVMKPPRFLKENVALMRSVGHERVRTFSIGFSDASFDELTYARQVAQALDTDHSEYVVDYQIEEMIPQLLRHFGEPFADSSAIPTYHLSRVTREGVTVALSGDGGDEIFGGYRRYQARIMADRYNRWPSWAGRGLFESLWESVPEPDGYYGTSWRKKGRRFVEFARAVREAPHTSWAFFLPKPKKLRCIRKILPIPYIGRLQNRVIAHTGKRRLRPAIRRCCGSI